MWRFKPIISKFVLPVLVVVTIAPFIAMFVLKEWKTWATILLFLCCLTAFFLLGVYESFKSKNINILSPNWSNYEKNVLSMVPANCLFGSIIISIMQYKEIGFLGTMLQIFLPGVLVALSFIFGAYASKKWPTKFMQNMD